MDGSEKREDKNLELGLRSGFIDASVECDSDTKPQFVFNEKDSGENLLSVIKRQLSSCESFDFCVAFVADSGLQPLVEVFAELKERGVRGRFLTSTYLNFNSPASFRKLLEYDNIDVRIYQGSMHAKGYVFDEHNGLSTVVIGSSNLTQTALTCNKEWNVLFRSYERGGMLQSIRKEYDSLWNSSSTNELSEAWIEEYESYRASVEPAAKRLPTFQYEAPLSAVFEGVPRPTIKPNKMQTQALEALKVLHEKDEPRALLVSATGTGKTYLSAFDVQAVKPRRVLFLVHRRRILQASMESYEKLLGGQYAYGMYVPGVDSGQITCMFAMCSTICRHLDEFEPSSFDYIVIDEAHRVGSETYRKITDYFTPKFYLGMTATPNRTNSDFDVFALFNHVIAYQITLQDALANEMLVPFHYFGIADLSINYEDQDDISLFTRLTSEERVRHITEKIEEYTIDRASRKGLVFCNRNDEARELSSRFNELGYRTKAVTGEDSDAVRDNAISQLESGELEYLFSVDIFNEGIDIPSVNQIIMLRRTESAIVFVQQLGRGLRKQDDKEYTLVLDFIGNYQKNFFVPVALSGDKTYNKDRLRRIVREGSNVIPGCSTVSFDRVSEARIYRAIDGGKFTAVGFLKDEYASLRQMLGHIPTLREFDENDSLDPLLIIKKFGSYYEFLAKYEKGYDRRLSGTQRDILKLVSQKLANGKRPGELEVIKGLLDSLVHEGDSGPCMVSGVNNEYTGREAKSIACVLDGSFFGSSARGIVPIAHFESGPFVPTSTFRDALENAEFRRLLSETIEFGMSRQAAQYAEHYKGTDFVLNAKYTYEEVCRLLGWGANVNGRNIGGYKYDADTNTYPVFINYDKDPNISDSIKYEDRFVSNDELIAISKQPRNLSSPEIQRLQAWPKNGMKTYLFMRKNKEDGESNEFYFLGEMFPTGSFKEIVMPGVKKTAVEITYHLDAPVRPDLYDFLTSDLSDGHTETNQV